MTTMVAPVRWTRLTEQISRQVHFVSSQVEVCSVAIDARSGSGGAIASEIVDECGVMLEKQSGCVCEYRSYSVSEVLVTATA